MAKLTIRLFGDYEALLDGQPLASARSPMRQALLAYLVAEPVVAHPREALMHLLWPGLPAEAAQTNLRQLIFQLRGAIPKVDARDGGQVPFLLSERQMVRVNPAAAFEADVATYDALLNDVRNHGHSDIAACRLCHDWLEEAIALYRGAFLADLYLEDSVGFEDWAHRRREAYRRQQLDALSTLAEMALRAGNYAAAQARAEEQLALDELDERATRQLMEALARNGRRREALAVYTAAEQRLRARLGMAPAARTAALADRIRGDKLEAVAPRPAAVRGYQLLDEIGAGAFGVVHRAYQPVIGREVAIKIIRPRYANHPDFIRRFEAEAQTVARLEHPHIVPLYDYWREPDNAYLVMRWLRGGNLEGRLAGGPLPLADTARIVDQLAAALHTAHRQHIIHRDVKAANILLDEDQNAYLSDFSVAKDLLTEEVPFGLHGSPEYISPEQLLREALSPQTDQYSLGVVLYQMLTGASPFAQDTPADTLRRQILNQPLPRVATQVPGMPGSIDDVIQRATAKKPGDRFPDMLALAHAFARAVGALGVAVGNGRQADPAAVATPAAPEVIVNPYKGLRAFQESDAATFFGREALVEHLVDRLQEEPADRSRGRFLAVVGPSGSGKSSVVKAGLLPALRGGALPGAEKWFITEMTPGRQPLRELELALLRVAVDPPTDLLDTLGHDTRGLIRVLERILPQEGGEAPQLLLVVDQLEELFTLTEDAASRQHFINSLLAALAEPDSRLRLVATLRADFYDRPLAVAGLGELLRHRTEVVLPLSPAELERAITRPAALAGVTAEPALTAAMTADVADGPGTLPLMQYALTELFDRRESDTMTHDAYRAIGGVSGALGRRAEELFDSLDAPDREAARQLFLRLITLGEGIEDTRRRATRAELEALEMAATPPAGAPTAIGRVIDTFGQYRLLTFDRDPVTRGPTVEVAHEALLREWPRLRTWLDESRADVRLQRLLAGAAAEWLAAGRDESYLLRGSRLKQFEDWAAETGLSLTEGERAFLDAGVALRGRREAEEEARRGRELETAQQLAATERRRAEEEARAAARLRRRAAGLAGAMALALVLAVLAFGFARSSARNAALAATRAAEALANAGLAASREAEAVGNAALAATREAEAQTSAELAATREAEAQTSAELAATRQAEAEAEALARATAEAEAISGQNLAISRELSLAALNVLPNDPELSILLALQGLATADTKQAQEALHRGIQAARTRLSYETGGRIMALSPEDGRLATLRAGEIAIWDSVTGISLLKLPIPEAESFWRDDLRFSPDGNRVAALVGPEEGGWDTMFLWDLSSNEVVTRTITHRPGQASVLNLNPELTHAVAGYEDGTAVLWDVATDEAVATFTGHDVPAWAVAFNEDGSLLATGDRNGQVFIWDVAASMTSGEGRRVASLTSPNGILLGASFLGGTRLLLNYQNFTMDVWDWTDSERALFTLPGISNIMANLAVNADGTRLAVALQDGTAQVWDLVTGERLLTLNRHALTLTGVAFYPDQDQVITMDGAGQVRLWDARPYASGEHLSAAVAADVLDLELSPDEQRLAIGNAVGPAAVFDLETQEVVHTLAGEEDSGVYRVAFSPDGRRVATVGQDNQIRIWDATSGRTLRAWTGHGEGNSGGFFFGTIDVAFSPDGTRLATAGTDGVAKVWDAATGEELLALAGHTAGLHSIAYSPDGRLIATSSDNRDLTVKVWDAESGAEIHTLSGHERRAWALAFTPDNRYLVTGADAVRVWDMATGELRATLPRQSEGAFDVAITPDGQHIVVNGGPGVRVWGLESGEEVLTVSGERVQVVEVSQDGRWLYTGALDGALRVYALQIDDAVAMAHERLTRWWQPAECAAYLGTETCPPPPDRLTAP